MPNNEKMEAIRRGLDLLYIPGDVIELRAFYDTGFDKLSTVSGFFNDLTALTKAINDVNSRMFSNGSGISVYVTANPVKQTWQEVTNKIFWSSKMLRREIKDTGNLETSPRLTHKKNFQTGETYHSLRTTDDTDILSRRWILLDIDAGQPVDTNSTAEEKDNAYKMASAVRDYLDTWGFPPMTLCDSGNGWHILVRVDFPNTPEVADIVKRFLASIAKKFDGKFGTAHLDTGVYNAARIVKAYGSKVFKGTNTLERPWRSSSVIHAPVETHIVTLEQVKKLADEFAPAGTWTGASALSDPEHRARVEETLAYLDYVNVERLSDPEISNGGWANVDIVCPNAENHTNGDMTGTLIGISPSGAKSVHCHHNSCQHMNGDGSFQRFRKMVETPGVKFDWEPSGKVLFGTQALA